MEISGIRRCFDVPTERFSKMRFGEQYPAMKRTLSSFFIALFFVSLAQAIEAGDAAREVTTAWGNPVAVRKKADGAQVWKFKDGTTVWLAGGIVQKIAAPTTGNLVQKGGSTTWVALPAENLAATTSSAAATSKVGNRSVDDILKISYFVLLAGLTVFAVIKLPSWLMLLVPLVSALRGRNRAWRFH